jgi:hypothetical protein
MADGSSKPIDQVHVGDMITNAQPTPLVGMKDQHHVVTAVHVTRDDRAYTDVTINTGHGPAIITGTAYHLYWDATTRSWTPADKLRIGDHLQSSNGALATILALRDYTTSMVTYNLTINKIHTYYAKAGSVSILVHNEDDSGLQCLIYEASPKHGPQQRGKAAPAPKNAQDVLLNRSVPIKSATTTRRVGVDPESGEFSVFDETYLGSGIYHGHARTWSGLSQDMQNALVRAGFATGGVRSYCHRKVGRIES